jgi:hypothetical protein
MMMSKYFVCCEKCFETIGQKSTNAARLWMDLCALRLQEGTIVSIRTQDFPELRILELLGFVVSTDKPQNVVIRINGHQLTNEGQDFFCLKEGQHEG